MTSSGAFLGLADDNDNPNDSFFFSSGHSTLALDSIFRRSTSFNNFDALRHVQEIEKGHDVDERSTHAAKSISPQEEEHDEDDDTDVNDDDLSQEGSDDASQHSAEYVARPRSPSKRVITKPAIFSYDEQPTNKEIKPTKKRINPKKLTQEEIPEVIAKLESDIRTKQQQLDEASSARKRSCLRLAINHRQNMIAKVNERAAQLIAIQEKSATTSGKRPAQAPRTAASKAPRKTAAAKSIPVSDSSSSEESASKSESEPSLPHEMIALQKQHIFVLNQTNQYQAHELRTMHTQNQDLLSKIAALEKDNEDLKAQTGRLVKLNDVANEDMVYLNDVINTVRDRCDHLKQQIVQLTTTLETERQATRQDYESHHVQVREFQSTTVQTRGAPILHQQQAMQSRTTSYSPQAQLPSSQSRLQIAPGSQKRFS